MVAVTRTLASIVQLALPVRNVAVPKIPVCAMVVAVRPTPVRVLPVPVVSINPRISLRAKHCILPIALSTNAMPVWLVCQVGIVPTVQETTQASVHRGPSRL